MQEAIDLGYLAVEADASSEEVLDARPASSGRAASSRRSAPTRRTSTPSSPRACCSRILFIIGRAETDDAKAKLVRAGADRVLSPYQIGGLQLAQTALRPAVVDFVQLATSSDNLELNMEQVRIERGAPLAGPYDHRGQPAPAIRRRRRRHPARRRADGVQSAARSDDASRATISSCSGRSENLRELEAVASGSARERARAR